MNEETLTCVSTFSCEWDADMARIVLETHGIYSSVFKDDCGGMSPFMQPVTGVRLMVRNSDVQNASEILKEIEKNKDS